MVNVDKLRGAIVERRMNIDQLADAIGADRSTLYRRLNTNGESFTIKEADSIAKVLSLTGKEAAAIFFAQFVA